MSLKKEEGIIRRKLVWMGNSLREPEENEKIDDTNEKSAFILIFFLRVLKCFFLILHII